MIKLNKIYLLVSVVLITLMPYAKADLTAGGYSVYDYQQDTHGQNLFVLESFPTVLSLSRTNVTDYMTAYGGTFYVNDLYGMLFGLNPTTENLSITLSDSFNYHFDTSPKNLIETIDFTGSDFSAGLTGGTGQEAFPQVVYIDSDHSSIANLSAFMFAMMHQYTALTLINFTSCSMTEAAFPPAFFEGIPDNRKDTVYLNLTGNGGTLAGLGTLTIRNLEISLLGSHSNDAKTITTAQFQANQTVFINAGKNFNTTSGTITDAQIDFLTLIQGLLLAPNGFQFVKYSQARWLQEIIAWRDIFLGPNAYFYYPIDTVYSLNFYFTLVALIECVIESDNGLFASQYLKGLKSADRITSANNIWTAIELLRK